MNKSILEAVEITGPEERPEVFLSQEVMARLKALGTGTLTPAPGVPAEDWQAWLAAAPAPTARRLCPKCGGRLVERTGPHGPFLGCSNYKGLGCKHTERA